MGVCAHGHFSGTRFSSSDQAAGGLMMVRLFGEVELDFPNNPLDPANIGCFLAFRFEFAPCGSAVLGL